jgi:hypothetical protein
MFEISFAFSFLTAFERYGIKRVRKEIVDVGWGICNIDVSSCRLGTLDFITS